MLQDLLPTWFFQDKQKLGIFHFINGFNPDNAGQIIHPEIRRQFFSLWNHWSIAFSRCDLVPTGVRVTCVLHSLIDLEG